MVGDCRAHCCASRRSSRSVQESAALFAAGDLDSLLDDRRESGCSTDACGSSRWTCHADGARGGRRYQTWSITSDRRGHRGWIAETREIGNIPDAYADQLFIPGRSEDGLRTRGRSRRADDGRASAARLRLAGRAGQQDGRVRAADEEAGALASEPGGDRDRDGALYHSLLQQNQELRARGATWSGAAASSTRCIEVETELSARSRSR